MEFFVQNLAPIMFAGLIFFLLLGFPVAFSLGACGLFFAFIGVELNVLPEALLQALPLRIFGIMQNDTLLAIPFFTLMGLILERSGMAEDLLETIGQLFGPVRGGLAFAVIFVGALLAATTGVVAASVISMGLISLPIMLRYGYDRRIAAGVIAASGTLAQIIPPSLVLIILADQLGRSVGDMYKGAFLPGMMLTGFYALYVVILAVFKPHWVPAMPVEARTLREDNGNSGLPSLAILTALCTAAAIYVGKNMPAVHTWWEGELVEKVALDETIVVAMCSGVALAFLAAMFNKVPVKGCKTVCVVSGGNIDVTILSRVINRGLSKSGRIYTFCVELDDKPGQLFVVSQIAASVGANIISVYHERNDDTSNVTACWLRVQVETRNAEHVQELQLALKNAGLKLI